MNFISKHLVAASTSHETLSLNLWTWTTTHSIRKNLRKHHRRIMQVTSWACSLFPSAWGRLDTYRHNYAKSVGGGGLGYLKIKGSSFYYYYIYLCCVARREIQWHCEVSVLLLFFHRRFQFVILRLRVWRAGNICHAVFCLKSHLCRG